MTKENEPQSIYRLIDNFTPKDLHKQEAVISVDELRCLLSKLPPELPIRLGCDDGVKLVWFNVGKEDEVLGLEENDGTWDEDAEDWAEEIEEEDSD